MTFRKIILENHIFIFNVSVIGLFIDYVLTVRLCFVAFTNLCSIYYVAVNILF